MFHSLIVVACGGSIRDSSRPIKPEFYARRRTDNFSSGRHEVNPPLVEINTLYTHGDLASHFEDIVPGTE